MTSSPLLLFRFYRLSLLLSFLLPGLGWTQSTAQVNPLADTRWRLIEFQSMDDAIGSLRPADYTLYLMQLHADGYAILQLDCNRATGNWSAQPAAEPASGPFSIGPLAMTRARCQPPNLDEHFAANAEYVTSYLLQDGRLYLSLLADAGIYTWEALPAAPLAPEQGGPRNWRVTLSSGQLNLREQPSPRAAVLASYPDGTLFDNLGCSQAGDRHWCDVQPLGGGPRGFVVADFLSPAVSPDGSVALGPDNSAIRAGQGDFDARGPLRCSLGDSPLAFDCEFQVARAGGGYATVVITRADGGQRLVYFRMGMPIGYSQSEADGYAPFSTSREGDNYFISIGTERYEVPDAVTLGG